MGVAVASSSGTEVRRGGLRARILAVIGGTWAAVVGAAPHVLHHVGPLAGAAIVSGVAGRVVFALLGFALTIPLLRRIHRHTRTWSAPTLALIAFVAIYLFSSFVVAPRLTGSSSSGPSKPAPALQPVDSGHDAHHGG